jgi:hypothetical protein
MHAHTTRYLHTQLCMSAQAVCMLVSLHTAAAIVHQDRDHNFCLSFFWNYWWPIMFIIYPFIGRIWYAGDTGCTSWVICSPAWCQYCNRQHAKFVCTGVHMMRLLCQLPDRCMCARLITNGFLSLLECRCSICPFMIYGEVMQRWRTAQGTVLRKWPREESECLRAWSVLG